MESKSDEEVEVSTEESAEALRERLAGEKKRNEELLTRLKYMQADLENYRKRMDKELKEAGESLMGNLLTKLLVVQDELDLASGHVQDGKNGEELREGIAMVRRNLESALESVGVKRIDAVGKPFDPMLHEAVERTQGEGDEDRVVKEIRPGFTFRGQLLRPSMVKVELGSKPTEGEKNIE